MRLVHEVHAWFIIRFSAFYYELLLHFITYFAALPATHVLRDACDTEDSELEAKGEGEGEGEGVSMVYV